MNDNKWFLHAHTEYACDNLFVVASNFFFLAK